MKIKVFKFEVSNSARIPVGDDSKTAWYKSKRFDLAIPEEIEDEINDFCCDKEIIDIKINTVDVHYHNNARANTIELWYTIMYKEA